MRPLGQALLDFEKLRTAFTMNDWRCNYAEVTMSGILVDYVWHSGGVWFYLHWAHHWKPSEMEAVVELVVSQSSTHRSCKHHMKYCAAGEPPGARNSYVEILAVHLPRCCLVDL